MSATRLYASSEDATGMVPAWEYYGVTLCEVGVEEVDEFIVLGHDWRRACAAVNRHLREHWDMRFTNLGGGKSEFQLEWWRFRVNCGCGESCQHKSGTFNGETFTDHECQWEDGWYGLPPCGDETVWMAEHAGAGQPDAYPVTAFRGLW